MEAAETAGLMDSLLRSLLRGEGDGRSRGNGKSRESDGRSGESGDGGSGQGGAPRETPQLLMTMAHLSQEREADLTGRYPGMQVRAVCVYALFVCTVCTRRLYMLFVCVSDRQVLEYSCILPLVFVLH